MSTPREADASAVDEVVEVVDASEGEVVDEPGYHGDKAAFLRRLKLIEGQVRGLRRLVQDDTYCIDVLTQVSAVSKALESFSLALADDHIHHCVQHAAASGDPAEIDRKMDEVTAVVRRLLK